MNAASAYPLPVMPSMRLDGRRALVTGAGRGIGAAAAVALAQAGAHVTLAARTLTELENLSQAIAAQGGAASVLQLDVTDSRAVQREIAREIAAHGPFAILVNNAGMNRPALLVDTLDADFDAVLSLNVKAAFYVLREVAKGLVHAGQAGSLITMSSQMGHVGSPRRAVYCATKHALEGMSKSLAWELGPMGIRVNTICPTFIETPMTAPMLENAEFRASVTAKIALGRIGQPEDIMGAVLYLASDASRLVTGSALMVDGGWTAV